MQELVPLCGSPGAPPRPVPGSLLHFQGGRTSYLSRPEGSPGSGWEPSSRTVSPVQVLVNDTPD